MTGTQRLAMLLRRMGLAAERLEVKYGQSYRYKIQAQWAMWATAHNWR